MLWDFYSVVNGAVPQYFAKKSTSPLINNDDTDKKASVIAQRQNFPDVLPWWHLSSISVISANQW
jgi:hypothetical protein